MAENHLKKTKLHEGREDLTGEHKWGDAGQVILFFIFLAVWIADSFFMETSTFLAAYVSLFLRLIFAVPVFIFAFYLSRKGLNIVFGNATTEPKVFRDSVFGIVRHPIYLGAILLYLGLILTTLSIISFGIWIIVVLFYVFISSYEEKILLERFGDEYRDYMNYVPMLVPRFWK